MRRPFFPIFFLLLAAGLQGRAAKTMPWPLENVSVAVDGELKRVKNTPRIDGELCVSLKSLRAVFGGSVSWQRVARRFVYRHQGREAEFRLDADTAMLDGKTLKLGTAVRPWGDDAYIPVSLFVTPEFQNLVASKIHWDPAQRALSVDPIPSVGSPQVNSYPHQSRVVLEIGPRVDYRLLSLRKDSVTVRLFNGKAREWERLEIFDGVVKTVEVLPKSRTTDLVVTLATGAGHVELFPTEGPRTLTLEIDRDPSAAPPLPVAVPVPEIASAPDLALAPPVPAATPAAAAKAITPYLALSPIKTIVIDAGHGGKDPGAVGPHGTYEKDVNLRIALALAKALRAEGRYKVILTRDKDEFITLADRSAVANKNKADLFISIHCNAGLAKNSSGFEIYYLSENASDDEAAAVARRENAVIELEGIGGKARGKVEELLWALARNEHINDSSEVAAHMSRQVGKRVSVPNRGVKQAGFYVLRGTSMPAVLIESAFITHPKEEGLLRSSRYHQKIADALSAGLLEYEKRKINARLHQSSGS